MTASRRRCAAVIFPFPAPGTRSLTAVTALARLSHRALRDHHRQQRQHLQPGPAQLARTARHRDLPRPAHRARPSRAASAVTSARSLRRPPASSTIAGPAAAATPKMSVADAGIVPGDESGSLTTR